jgi:hypothetical protein
MALEVLFRGDNGVFTIIVTKEMNMAFASYVSENMLVTFSQAVSTNHAPSTYQVQNTSDSPYGANRDYDRVLRFHCRFADFKHGIVATPI